MLALGRLLRLSLLPSALADVAAGMVFLTGVWPPGWRPWLLLTASLGLYHGGMALNDWADRRRDQETAPGRPLPAGELTAGFALWLGLGLVGGGTALAWTAGPLPGILAVGVAVAVLGYDLGSRGPLRGPLLLALARAGNMLLGVGLGMSLRTGSEPGLMVALGPPLLYATYVFLVSRLGRLEDGEDAGAEGRRPPHLLLGAAVLLLAASSLTPPEPLGPALLERGPARVVSFLIVGVGVVLLARRARAGTWTPERVRGAMGTALRCLLLFTAGLAVLPGTLTSLVCAAVILAGYPVGFFLRRAFPPS